MRAMQAWLVIVGIFFFFAFLMLRKQNATPPVKLPEPDGRLPIGTSLIVFDDTARGRPIAAQAWYPRAPGPCENFAPYFPFPGWANPREFASVRTHACRDANPAEGTHPAIIFSPGWDGGSFQNTALCEALASAGFVVFALNHPGAAPLVRLPDGRTLTNDRLEKFDLSTAEASATFFRAAEHELAARASDVEFVIGSLPDLDSGIPAGGKFRGRLDTDRIGVAGFSFGGAVAAEVCRLDPRVKAGANLDGNLFGKSRRSGSAQPFLFLTDNLPPPTENDLRSPDPAVRRNAEFLSEGYQDYEHWRQASGAEIVRIPGITHPGFADEALIAGPEEAARLRGLNARAVEFFESALGKK